jgi:phage shock protein B
MDYDMLIAIPIVFLAVVAPLWVIMHYVTKMKMAKSLSAADEEGLAELWRMANRLEERVDSLETILDQDTPGWRNDR